MGACSKWCPGRLPTEPAGRTSAKLALLVACGVGGRDRRDHAPRCGGLRQAPCVRRLGLRGRLSLRGLLRLGNRALWSFYGVPDVIDPLALVVGYAGLLTRAVSSLPSYMASPTLLRFLLATAGFPDRAMACLRHALRRAVATSPSVAVRAHAEERRSTLPPRAKGDALHLGPGRCRHSGLLPRSARSCKCADSIPSTTRDPRTLAPQGPHHPPDRRGRGVTAMMRHSPRDQVNESLPAPSENKPFEKPIRRPRWRSRALLANPQRFQTAVHTR